jgi:hypothetical protein
MAADDKEFIPLPLAPKNPISAALMMINGNGTRKKKIAINAAAANVHITSFFKARLPMRMTAAATIASTAGFRP